MNNVKDIRKVRLGDGMMTQFPPKAVKDAAKVRLGDGMIIQFPPKAVKDAAKVRLGDGMSSVPAEGGEGRREGAARRCRVAVPAEALGAARRREGPRPLPPRELT